MGNRPRVFLDTSVLFAAVLSAEGGSRLVLKLGEAGAISLWVGPRVLQEADGMVLRKVPQTRSLLALLLDRAGVMTGPELNAAALARARAVVSYAPDAHILAEALSAEVDYFVTLDRQHFVDNSRTATLPFPVGTPADFLAWLRERLGPARRLG
ncbi:MAG: PIN domain-containing protein [Anaerolineae bacterium]|jgi:predicted nucleic acid-binding protein|nr:PIN domain-containing protein [Anaerolineae bacterium]MDH7473016.1 PIN domain-containing protein [Anaerolineae bacterium]